MRQNGTTWLTPLFRDASRPARPHRHLGKEAREPPDMVRTNAKHSKIGDSYISRSPFLLPVTGERGEMAGCVNRIFQLDRIRARVGRSRTNGSKTLPRFSIWYRRWGCAQHLVGNKP